MLATGQFMGKWVSEWVNEWVHVNISEASISASTSEIARLELVLLQKVVVGAADRHDVFGPRTEYGIIK